MNRAFELYREREDANDIFEVVPEAADEVFRAFDWAGLTDDQMFNFNSVVQDAKHELKQSRLVTRYGALKH